MENKFNRALRRHQRARSIQHAFNVRWYKWGFYENSYTFFGWRKDIVVLETEEQRRQYQDEHREDVLMTAKFIAEHLRTCSCYMCSGYKKYEISYKQKIQLAKDAFEIQDTLISFEEFQKCPHQEEEELLSLV